MTPTEIKVLDFVRSFTTRAGFAPTYGEISKHFGFRARSSAHRLVESLIASGHLIHVPGRNRGLAIPDAIDLRGVDTPALIAELRRRGVEPSAFNADARRATGSNDVSCACCRTAVPMGHMFCRQHYWAISEGTRNELFRAHRQHQEHRDHDSERRYRRAYEQAVAEATGRVAA